MNEKETINFIEDLLVRGLKLVKLTKEALRNDRKVGEILPIPSQYPDEEEYQKIKKEQVKNYSPEEKQGADSDNVAGKAEEEIKKKYIC